MDFQRKLSLILENYGQKELCPQLWENEKLYPAISKRLLEIADDFAAEHEIEKSQISDITLTGSLANYNWTELSDIDLHLIIDFNNIGSDKELLTDYFKLAKSAWNNNHDIQLCGHEVEIYVQDVAEKHYSSGVYSLLHDEWLAKPSERPTDVPDEKQVDDKAERYISEIDNLEKWAENGDDITDLVRDIKEKIRTMRKSGLMQGGEYSLENLVFKKLRNDGYLHKLNKLSKVAYDTKMSIDKCPTD